MTATKDKTCKCPHCEFEMNLESVRVLQFIGGRGEVKVERFHCFKCRRFHNVPVPEKK